MGVVIYDLVHDVETVLANKIWKLCLKYQGLFQQFWEKAPGQNWGKNDRLNIKSWRNYDIEHNKGSKVCPKNQVILDCIMPNIHLSTNVKYHSDMGHCFS